MSRRGKRSNGVGIDATSQEASQPSELHELAGDFDIHEEVGRGGTAVVYRAHERAIDRVVAIKVIRARYVGDDEQVARLEREARMVARLDHPNVVALHTVRRLRHGSIALIMQFVDGQSVRDLLRDSGPPDARRATRILADVARALAAAHAHGMVHRDVKPENIYLDRKTSRALLADFGAAAPLAADARLTMAGMTIGTPGYLAPEVIDGSDATPRSDVFALGLVGWELVTGLQPWAGSTLLDILTFRKHGHLPRVDEVQEDVPGALAEAIEGALHPDPEQRWPSADAFLSVMLGPARPSRARRPTATAAALLLPPSVQPTAATIRFRRDEFPSLGPPSARPEVVGSTAALAGVAGSSLGEDDVKDGALVEGEQGVEAVEPPARRGRFAHLGPGRLAIAAGLAAVFAIPIWLAGRDVDRERAGDVTAAITDAPTTISIPVARPDFVPEPAPEPVAADTIATDAAEPVPDAPEDPPAAVAATPAPPATAPDPPPPATRGNVSAPSPQRTVAVAPRQSPPAPAPARAAPVPAPPAAVTSAAPASAPPAAPAEAPPEAAGAGLVVRNVSLGGMHSCAVAPDGSALCWGGSDRGQAGDRGGARVPRAVGGSTVRFRSVALGLTHSCGIGQDGSVHCWGNNDKGQLGDGTRLARSTPVAVAGVGRATALALGAEHSCALETGGTVRCWGNNESGQLGTGRAGAGGGAVVVAWSEPFARIAAGWHHTCGVTENGRAVCWGSNQRGQLGDGSSTSRAAPVPVSTSLRFTSLAGGHSHTCGVSSSGSVSCWGRNHVGQLGNGSSADARTPQVVRLSGAASRVVAGSQHSCALLRGGDAVCWGQNSFGQLGDGTTTDRAVPTRVVEAPSFADLEASSGTHTCGTTARGNVHCWGYNGYGQLGDGTRTNRSRPVLVARPGG